jgi:PBSX family phage terminase large subunit
MKTNYFSPKQVKVLKHANKRWNMLYGATRSGKTRITYYLVPLRIKEHWDGNVLLVGKTVNTLERNVFDPMREIFGNEHVSKLIDKKEIIIFGKKCYVVGANDERSEQKIRGMSVSYAYCDEITTYPETFFQMLKSRLDKPGAKCDATCNPESPSHFIKQHIDNTGEEWIYAEHFTIYDNPFLDENFVRALESEYRGTIYFDKWILGNWVKAEGLVFPLFKRESHYLTPQEYSARFGRNRLTAVIFGCDGANTNDSTAVIPLAIMDNGQAVTLEMFYHNPKVNGQLSNEQLVPMIMRYMGELDQKYRLRESGADFYTVVDCAAADLHLSLAYHLPDWYNVRKYTKKDILQTTDIVNNAFARGVLCILNFGGYYNYYRKEFITGENQLVIDLELMTWDERNEKYDPSVPNDCADAFRYAVCTFYANPENIWETPSQNERFKEIANE